MKVDSCVQYKLKWLRESCVRTTGVVPGQPVRSFPSPCSCRLGMCRTRSVPHRLTWSAEWCMSSGHVHTPRSVARPE